TTSFLESSTWPTNLSKFAKEGPPSCAAFAAMSFHSMALLFISFPFSPPMISLINPSTSFLFTSPSISIPIPHSAHYLQLVCCSAKKGQHSIGTPPHTLSSVEFHPLCVRNAPTAGWQSTSSCGHQFAMSPLSFVPSTNSGGSTAASPLTRSGLMIHRNSYSLFASPHANSISCWFVMTTTDPGLLFSNHCKQAGSSFHRLEPTELSGPWGMRRARRERGPMV
ncbi:hypothetical protein ACMD2_23657, partial [Ananas comosus]